MDGDPDDPVIALDPHRLAEVIVALPGGGARRGSGYRVGPTAVLTAAHVVAEASRVLVRFDADTPGEWCLEASDVVADDASDIAVLAVPAPPGTPEVRSCTFGRTGLATERLAVQAVGFPRFKLNAYSGHPSDGSYRDSHQAIGSVAPLSNRRSGTFEVSVPPPGRDPDPRTSPWEGMSGAALWAGDRIIGVLTEHHRGDGLGRLVATRITRLGADARPGSAAERVRTALGLPALADELPAVDAPGRTSVAAYRHQVLDVAPDPLLGRDAELAELAEFARGDEPYGWWQGEPWSGKTALATWFALHPPPGIAVVPFLVAAGLTGQSDSDAFLEAVSEQLAALARRPAGAPATTAARRRDLLALLDDAAARCRETGRRLVLLVDGLDEDTGPAGRTASIASLLPRRPPEGTVVLVTSRPHRPLPSDVPAGHPLHRCAPRWLPPSTHARDGEAFARQELAERLREGPLHEELLGLITASGGGLGRDDLAALTGTSPFAVQDLLAGAFGRSTATRARQLTGGVPARGYVLAHRTLQEIAEREFGAARLAQLRDRLHGWAGSYRSRGWPADTPVYLLRDYQRVLAMAGDRERLTALATDERRHDRMLEATGGDALALDEIALARPADERRPDLTAAVRLAVRREELTGRNRQTPVRLPAVWAALGRLPRAEALARGIPQRGRRTGAFAAAALAAARAGRLDDAEVLAASVTDPDRRDALLAAAAGAAAEHDPDRAERWARARTPQRRDAALARVAATSAERDRERAAAIVAEIAATAAGPSARTAVAVAAVAVGASDLARSLVAGVTSARQRTRARIELAVALATAGVAATAKEIADTIRPPGARLPVLAALVRAGPVPGVDGRLLAELQETARAASHRGAAVGELLGLAVTMADRGDGPAADGLLAEAGGLVAGIADDDRREWALARLAVAHAATGDVDRAEAVLDRLGDPERRAGALTEMAVEAVRRGAPERAESLIRRVPDAGRRMHALTDLAAAFADHGDAERAAAVASEVERIARATGDPRRLAVLAARVVDGLIATEDLPTARSVAEGIADATTRGSALSRVAEALARAGDVAGALDLARSLDDPERRAWVLVAISESHAVSGGPAVTVEAVRGTADAVEQHFGDAYSQVVALLRLAEAARGVGADDPADQLAARARDAAEDVADPGQRARAHTRLSLACEAAGDADGAAHHGQVAATALAAIEDRPRRDRALTRVAEALAAAGCTGRAEETAAAIAGPQGRVRALSAIAASGVAPERAWILLSRAEALLDDVDDAGERAAATARLVDAATTVLTAAGGRVDDPADPHGSWLARRVAALLGGDGWLEAVLAVARLDPGGFAVLVHRIARPDKAILGKN
ncbi:trypsin-like peptidase domain-containing protein [Pseudonocardia sp. MH-G8]|uniref:trypsin-like peptidase domain-containing protein n=1 Tax=Pseudonocardia sp. MH-G8 TaxID=1854588 RepID=UPI0013044938|nr:trypsin-like peptidase domain-containing protein [Pseudonocardia sp. MH-G8]